MLHYIFFIRIQLQSMSIIVPSLTHLVLKEKGISESFNRISKKVCGTECFRNKTLNNRINSICWSDHNMTINKSIKRAKFNLHNFIQSYVYWIENHLNSWIKRDQLHVTCFIISLFNAQHVSDVNTSILRILRPMK